MKVRYLRSLLSDLFETLQALFTLGQVARPKPFFSIGGYFKALNFPSNRVATQSGNILSLLLTG